MRVLLAVAAMSAALAGCAGSSSYQPMSSGPIPGPQASIPFADHGGVRDFHAVNDHSLYLQARDRQWYRADLFARCDGLPYAVGIGVDARPNGSLDRFGSIIVGRQRCKIASLVPSDSPREQDRG